MKHPSALAGRSKARAGVLLPGEMRKGGYGPRGASVLGLVCISPRPSLPAAGTVESPVIARK